MERTEISNKFIQWLGCILHWELLGFWTLPSSGIPEGAQYFGNWILSSD
jgi:hypothetical protein